MIDSVIPSFVVHAWTDPQSCDSCNLKWTLNKKA